MYFDTTTLEVGDTAYMIRGTDKRMIFRTAEVIRKTPTGQITVELAQIGAGNTGRTFEHRFNTKGLEIGRSKYDRNGWDIYSKADWEDRKDKRAKMNVAKWGDLETAVADLQALVTAIGERTPNEVFARLKKVEEAARRL